MNVLTAVQRSRFVFPLACVAAVGMMLISEGSYWRSVNSMDALGTQAAARMQIQRLRQSLVDAETGQRGFLLTGRPAYLKPYREALTAVDEAYHALQERYSDKEPQLKVLRKTLGGTPISWGGMVSCTRMVWEARTVLPQMSLPTQVLVM